MVLLFYTDILRLRTYKNLRISLEFSILSHM